MHGKLSPLQYEKTGLFAQLDGDIEVMRYHSLIIEEQTLHKDFKILATSGDDGRLWPFNIKIILSMGCSFTPNQSVQKKAVV